MGEPLEPFFYRRKDARLAGVIERALPDICSGLPGSDMVGNLPGVQVAGIASDSREVKPGYIFVAIPGMVTDGHRFISQAVARGAVAVVGSQEINHLSLPYIKVPDPRQALAWLAAAFYGRPAHSLTVIGVTGTDGKTTTANLIYQILQKAGVPVGIISTVNALIGQEAYDTGFHVTTPQAPEIQHYLFQMREMGITHAVLEATSHGLAQHRVTGCEFDMGVLTNITHEHINDHGSFEAYRQAKARLFTELAQRPEKPNGLEPLAVLNRDDPSFEYLDQQVAVSKITYSIREKASLWAEDIHQAVDGLHFLAVGNGLRLAIHCRIPGIYNVSNCLAALAATLIGLGIDPQAAQEGIASLEGLPGRMEQLDLGQPFLAIVDFAHTPNALQQAFISARQMTTGRVIVVIGSAGLRDRQKRHMMAEIAADLADFSFFTAEDPRTESLDAILDEMAQGALSRGGVEGRTFSRVPDRGEAIRRAVDLARKGDLVITCGKGHEQSMCFGEIEYPWDDRTAMRAALSEWMGVPGPRMPYLPTQEQHA